MKFVFYCQFQKNTSKYLKSKYYHTCDRLFSVLPYNGAKTKKKNKNERITILRKFTCNIFSESFGVQHKIINNFFSLIPMSPINMYSFVRLHFCKIMTVIYMNFSIQISSYCYKYYAGEMLIMHCTCFYGFISYEIFS